MSTINTLPIEEINAFCKKWGIEEFSLFGSILRADFNPTSDVDVLVSFLPGSTWTLFDQVEMKQDLELIFHRKVDLITKKGIANSRNYIRKNSILNSAKRIYFSE